MSDKNYRVSFRILEIAGNIGTSAQVKTVQYKDTTAQVAQFTMCSTIVEGKKLDELWVNVSIWESQKSLMAMVPKLITGKNVRVRGRFKISKWKAKDGTDQATPSISADDVSFYDPGNTGSRNYYTKK